MNAVDVSSKRKKACSNTKENKKRVSIRISIYIALYLTVPKTILLKLVTFTP